MKHLVLRYHTAREVNQTFDKTLVFVSGSRAADDKRGYKVVSNTSSSLNNRTGSKEQIILIGQSCESADDIDIVAVVSTLDWQSSSACLSSCLPISSSIRISVQVELLQG
ncbi:hypothetical protein VTL71DRAFT_851 [Oculimacula yallundae]|uniref:Uncharacterized protein n=1 Tax=Oculimacula yallundae TaxID=86028 RepID=A0ABR4D2N1_9HELO